MRIIIGYAAFSCLVLTSVAQAHVIVEQGAYTGLLDSSSTVQPPFLLIPQFDSALGNLQSASLEIKGLWYPEAIIFGGVNPPAPTLQATLNSSLSFALADYGTPFGVTDKGEALFQQTFSPQTITLTGNGSKWVGDGQELRFDMTFPLDLATVGPLLTSGLPYDPGNPFENDEILMNIDGYAYIYPHPDNFISGGPDPEDGTFGSFTGTLTYTYDPIPEPPPAALLVLPVMMIVARRVKRA